MIFIFIPAFIGIFTQVWLDHNNHYSNLYRQFMYKNLPKLLHKPVFDCYFCVGFWYSFIPALVLAYLFPAKIIYLLVGALISFLHGLFVMPKQ